MQNPIEPLFLSREQTAQFVNLSAPGMQRLLAAGDFPKPRQLSTRRVGWLVRELREWGESRPVSDQLPPMNCGRNDM